MRRRVMMAVISLIFSLQAEKLTLKEVEERALKNSFEVKIKLSEERSKDWEEKNAIANYLPKVDYGLVYLKTDPDFVDQNNSPFNPMYKNSFSHEITVNQPITNGGAEIIAIQIASQLKKSFQYQKQDVLENAVSDARSKYFDLVLLRENKNLLKKTIEWKTLNLNTARIKQKTGAIVQTDLLRWETELLISQNELQMLEMNEKSALFSLYQSMGEIIPENESELELHTFVELEQLYAQSKIDSSISINQSASSQIMKENIELAKSFKQLKFSSFLPKVNAFYNLKWPTTDEFVPKGSSSFWNAGISVSIPIFYGFRNYTAYQQAQCDEKTAVINYQYLQNNLSIAKKNISYSYSNMLRSVALAKQKIELTTKQLEAIQKRYDLGGISQSVLLEVESAVKGARLEYLSLILSVLKLETEYNKITGKMEVN